MKDSDRVKDSGMADLEEAELAELERKERKLATARTTSKVRSLTHEQRREILDQLFFEGDRRKPYIIQFYTLLTLSTIIATFGLMRNSAAVVIGAMLISPLMTPILGVAASLVMGWPIRAGRVALRLSLATFFVFALGYLTPFALRIPTNVVIPPEILARTNPNLAELLVALCAGLAAAYMLVRKEAVSALPGVAIAVALVPPLCVAGLLTYLREYVLAWEAFVLYATNLVAIILTTGAVLLITGFKPRVKDLKLHLRVTAGMAMAAFFVILVAVPLGFRMVQDISDMHDRQVSIMVINEWIGKNPVEVVAVEVENDLVQVFLRVNLPYETLQKGTRASRMVMASLDPEMTLKALQSRLMAALNKEVQITVKGSLSYWTSTCPVPADCYY